MLLVASVCFTYHTDSTPDVVCRCLRGCSSWPLRYHQPVPIRIAASVFPGGTAHQARGNPQVVIHRERARVLIAPLHAQPERGAGSREAIDGRHSLRWANPEETEEMWGPDDEDDWEAY